MQLFKFSYSTTTETHSLELLVISCPRSLYNYSSLVGICYGYTVHIVVTTCAQLTHNMEVGSWTGGDVHSFSDKIQPHLPIHSQTLIVACVMRHHWRQQQFCVREPSINVPLCGPDGVQCVSAILSPDSVRLGIVNPQSNHREVTCQ